VFVDHDGGYPGAAMGSIREGSLFVTLPTRGLTGRQVLSSEE